jgi:hypothetical protein
VRRYIHKEKDVSTKTKAFSVPAMMERYNIQEEAQGLDRSTGVRYIPKGALGRKKDRMGRCSFTHAPHPQAPDGNTMMRKLMAVLNETRKSLEQNLTRTLSTQRLENGIRRQMINKRAADSGTAVASITHFRMKLCERAPPLGRGEVQTHPCQ